MSWICRPVFYILQDTNVSRQSFSLILKWQTGKNCAPCPGSVVCTAASPAGRGSKSGSSQRDGGWALEYWADDAPCSLFHCSQKECKHKHRHSNKPTSYFLHVNQPLVLDLPFAVTTNIYCEFLILILKGYIWIYLIKQFCIKMVHKSMKTMPIYFDLRTTLWQHGLPWNFTPETVFRIMFVHDKTWGVPTQGNHTGTPLVHSLHTFVAGEVLCVELQ